MFDIGFPELLLLSIVALIVLGPQRLPEAMRTLGHWYNQIRFAASRLRSELDSELNQQVGATIRSGHKTVEALDSIRAETQEVIDQTANALQSGSRGSKEGSGTSELH